MVESNPRSRPTKVCHISSVHRVNDIRVFHKECKTLASAGFDVTLIGRDATVDKSGVRIIVLNSAGGRLKRIIRGSYQAYRLARERRADIYHLHDPELLLYGLLLKRTTQTKVVFDSHECYPEDIQTKEWIPKRLRRPAAFLFKYLEDFIVRRLDMVVAATPHIERRFIGIAPRTVTINNFPIQGEFPLSSASSDKDRDGFCYVGAISFVRGIVPLMNSLDDVTTGTKFYLAGPFASPEVESAVRTHRNWRRVTFLGEVSRVEIAGIYNKSFAGVVNFLASPNHMHSQPNKLFEYMSAGIPVICSDFPLWREIVETGGCGVCVNPDSGADIAAAINAISHDKAYWRELSNNGRRVISERYSWESEGQRLIEAYVSLGVDNPCRL